MINLTSNTLKGFWTGWLCGSVIIAGGKLWTVLVNPQLSVSGLLGHIGKPLFRRQLATAFTVYAFSNTVFLYIHQKWQRDSKKQIGTVYQISTQALSAALGSAAAISLSHSNYHILLYSVCTLSVALALLHIRSLWKANTQASHQSREVINV